MCTLTDWTMCTRLTEWTVCTRLKELTVCTVDGRDGVY